MNRVKWWTKQGRKHSPRVIGESCCQWMHFWKKSGINGTWALEGVASRDVEQHMQIHLGVPFCEVLPPAFYCHYNLVPLLYLLRCLKTKYINKEEALLGLCRIRNKPHTLFHFLPPVTIAPLLGIYYQFINTVSIFS